MNWGELYAHLIACTGYTWEYIENNMDLPRLASMNAYWAKHPPLHLMIQHFMGIEAKSELGEQLLDAEPEMDILDFAQQFPQG